MTGRELAWLGLLGHYSIDFKRKRIVR